MLENTLHYKKKAEFYKKNCLVHGIGIVSFSLNSKGNVSVKNLYQKNPVRILFPIKIKKEINSAIFVVTSGGLLGGDFIELEIQTCSNTKVIIYQQSAEKIYKSKIKPVVINLLMKVEKNSWLEWLPQETIIFNESKFIRNTHIEVEQGGKLMTGEILVLGRHAMNEIVKKDFINENLEIYYGGKLVWGDSFFINDIEKIKKHPAGLNGANSLATIIFVSEKANQLLGRIREAIEENKKVKIGATVVNNVLIIRFLSLDPLELKNAFGKIWAFFRQLAEGLNPSLPRLWNV